MKPGEISRAIAQEISWNVSGMSKLFTKAEIARIYKVTPRTVSNWLSRARVEMGDEFPGNYEGNALAFTDDQVDELLKFSNGAESKSAEPEVKVMPPDVDESTTALSVVSHDQREVTPILHIHYHAIPVARPFFDTTKIEAETERAEAMTSGHANVLADVFSARFAGKITAAEKRQDQLIAGIEALAVSQGVQALEQGAK